MRKTVYFLVKPFDTGDSHPTLEFLRNNLNSGDQKVVTVEKPKYKNWLEEATDLPNRVNKIKQEIGKISKEKQVVIVSASLGGLESVLACGDCDRVDGLVVINGFFDRGIVDIKLKRFRYLLSILKYFSRKLRKLEKGLRDIDFSKIKTKVLVVLTEDDEVLKLDNSLWFYKNVTSPKKLFRLRHGGHMLDDDEVRKIVAEKINHFSLDLLK